MNWGDPNIHVPWRPKPGCLEAIRAKVATLTGCLTFGAERALWVIVGAVIGAVVIGDNLTPSLLSVLGSVLGFIVGRLPWMVVGAVIGILWAKRRHKVVMRGCDV